MQQLADDILNGVKAAAEYTGLPERTIYNLTEKGQVPATKLGRRLFFRKSELDRAFSSNRAA